MKKTVAAVLLIALFALFVPSEARADEMDNDMLTVLKSSFYGGVTGALIGTAFMALRDKPSDHTEDIRIGAGIGVIVGAVYGIAKTTRAFAEIQDGQVIIQAPTLQFDIDPETHDLKGSVDLLKIPF